VIAEGFAAGLLFARKVQVYPRQELPRFLPGFTDFDWVDTDIPQ
jgi:hypothetical protein